MAYSIEYLKETHPIIYSWISERVKKGAIIDINGYVSNCNYEESEIINNCLRFRNYNYFYNVVSQSKINRPSRVFYDRTGEEFKIGDKIAFASYSSTIDTGIVVKECKRTILVSVSNTSWNRIIYKRKIHEQVVKLS
jgi:hypothetical protein